MFFGNQYIGKFTCDGRRMTKWQRIIAKAAHITKKTIIYALIANLASWGAIGIYQYGKSNAEPITVQAKEIIEVPVLDSPVLARIAKCESGGSQTDKTGQVLLKVNTNGTVDIGKYQINSIWKATATKLGFDLTKEKDNESFAQWMYLNKGTGDWSASAKCWNK